MSGEAIPLRETREGSGVGSVAPAPPSSETHPPPAPPCVQGGEKVANAARGEASLAVGGELLLLRPSFAALVAAEEELGPLFALVERAAEGRLTLAEMAALFWHCAHGRASRAEIGAAIVEQGLAGVTPALKALLTQILQGRL